MQTPTTDAQISIDDLVWLSGLTDQQLADAAIDPDGFEGRLVAFPEAVVRRAKGTGSRRDVILREHVRKELEQWVNHSKLIRDEHAKLLRGTSL